MAAGWLWGSFGAPLLDLLLQGVTPETRPGLWSATMHALTAWFLLAAVASPAIYAILTPLLRRSSESLQTGAR